uniref:Uncharacterized protein n=1 Tax=Arion vulgaris TaxID=1028688 RepID=A0A0B6ZUL5_9EUPU
MTVYKVHVIYKISPGSSTDPLSDDQARRTPQLRVMPSISCGQYVNRLNNGYVITRPNDAAPRIMLYVFNCRSMARAQESCTPRKTKAWNWEISPAAKGLTLVLATFESISLSHMSLIIQPAPRMKNAPAPNKVKILKSGRHPGSAAKAILHVQGQYRSQLPIGLSNLISRRYG